MLIQSRNQVKEAIQTGPTLQELNALDTLQHRVQAPPHCSDCYIIRLKRLQCPNRGHN